VQINDLTRGYLIEKGLRVRAPIVAEQFVAARPRLTISPEVPCNPRQAQASPHEIQTVHGLLKRPNAGIVAAAGLDEHHGFVTHALQPFMQSICSSSGTSRKIALANVNNRHIDWKCSALRRLEQFLNFCLLPHGGSDSCGADLA
jgi:hypothetical protein